MKCSPLRKRLFNLSEILIRNHLKLLGMETKTVDWSKDQSSLGHEGDPYFQKNKPRNESQSYSKNPTQPGFTSGSPQPLGLSTAPLCLRSLLPPRQPPPSHPLSPSPTMPRPHPAPHPQGLCQPRCPCRAGGRHPRRMPVPWPTSWAATGTAELLTGKLKPGTGCPPFQSQQLPESSIGRREPLRLSPLLGSVK